MCHEVCQNQQLIISTTQEIRSSRDWHSQYYALYLPVIAIQKTVEPTR